MHEFEKLDEARYFLTRMTACADQPRAFRYDLSAFLSAARSALQYALDEASGRCGQAWYDAHVNASAVIKFFRDKRDINIHQQPVVPMASMSTGLTEAIHPSDSLSIKVMDLEGRVIQEGTTPPDPVPTHEPVPPVISYRYSFVDWTGTEDVPSLCLTYLTAIEAVVKDGVAKSYLTSPA